MNSTSGRNGQQDNIVDSSFQAFSSDAETAADAVTSYVAFGLFKADQKRYYDGYVTVNHRAPSTRELRGWTDTFGSQLHRDAYRDRAASLLSEAFTQATVTLVNEKVEIALDENYKLVEEKFLGDLKQIVRQSADAQISTARDMVFVSSALSNIQSFWRNVSSNIIANFVAGVITLLFIGLLAFGVVYKDAVTWDGKVLQVVIPHPASAAASK